MGKSHKKQLSSKKMKLVEQPSVLHGYLQSFDGTRIFYSSEGSGKALVFLHGLVCTNLHWNYQISSLKADYKTVWFDYRGHRASDIPVTSENLTLEAIAKDVHAVLDQLGINEAILVGHSMGVNVALEAMHQKPGRFKGMILSNGSVSRPLDIMLGTNMWNHFFWALRVAHEKNPGLFKVFWQLQKQNVFGKFFIRLMGFNPFLADPRDIEAYIQQALSIDPLVFLKLLEDYQHIDPTPLFREIHVPTLIIAGENDKVTPLVQQELIHQLIPNSELEVIKHGSHCPQLDLPDLISGKIKSFLEKIGY
jgi:pimeloyl-ACP methyl ester carboxylesterase